ncbi:unnamed protein product [Adineta ricciae]|uniref:Major facilitator superfamily (MFS) profile domain-containing protein n=1 Tax=Adineta ricciae TaxID=249248 RepID=A0A815TNV7_ADIRI|nr:unnamed protein product [Adineta ricciae]CAF1508583.1 unnamed protein product [Adineta ricciae]
MTSEVSLPQKQSSHTIEQISIYDVRTNCQCRLILLALSIAVFLLPFSDFVYLPALTEIERDMNTSDAVVEDSVSVYLFMGGISSLFWGSISDRYGRKLTLIASLSLFATTSIVCIRAANVILLVFSRAIQGATISATLVIGQAIIADIYPEEKRGSAAGWFFLPFNIGPIGGPLLGGPLSSAFTWHSTFVLLAIFSICAIIMILILVPETHQYYIKEQFHKTNPDKRIIDVEFSNQTQFKNPLKAVTYLYDLTILPYIAVAAATYATLTSTETLFPTYLGKSPYNFSQTTMGLLYVPSGIVLFISSLLGGWLSDLASDYYGHKRCLEGRVVPNLILSILTPIGLLIFGWSVQYNAHISVVIGGLCIASCGQALFEPCASAYLTAKKQSDAGVVSAANVCLNLCASGALVSIGVPLIGVIGSGAYFSLLAALTLMSIVPAGVIVYNSIKRASHSIGEYDAIVLELDPANENTKLRK